MQRHRILPLLLRIANVLWITTLAGSLTLIVLTSYLTGNGGAALRWLRDLTGEESWSLALSAGGYVIFEIAAVVAPALVVLRFILRRILLLGAYADVGVVANIGQTGTSVNQRPLMALNIRVDTPTGPAIASLRKLIDLGNMPRPGDRVRLRVSRIDPTCVSYDRLA